MPRIRTPLEKAAGKLIAEIQKEWMVEMGEPTAEQSESVMNLAHGLLQGAKSDELARITGGRSIVEYLGEVWVDDHPRIRPYIEAFEAAMTRAKNV